MTIRALLNSGRSNETALEKAADIMLAFPRLMWHGRSVKVEMQTNGCAQVNEYFFVNWIAKFCSKGTQYSCSMLNSLNSGSIEQHISRSFTKSCVLAKGFS